jgi:2-polyprenyl-3-methyl-5-hydroxy-6-metoxy-1,4-benzoquinol methylase
MLNEKQLHKTRQYWDAQATSFDQEPDHGLNDPNVLAAWTELLKTALPTHPANLLDIGCGTGSLSIVLAQLGHRVTGIDLSPDMIEQAKKKTAVAGLPISYHVMEASYPQLSGQPFDAIICRHLLWALPNLPDVLEHWMNLLTENGRLLLIEGFWHTGGGLHSAEIIKTLPPSLTHITVQNLSDQPAFWGREVNDEHYAILAQRQQVTL